MPRGDKESVHRYCPLSRAPPANVIQNPSPHLCLSSHTSRRTCHTGAQPQCSNSSEVSGRNSSIEELGQTEGAHKSRPLPCHLTIRYRARMTHVKSATHRYVTVDRCASCGGRRPIQHSSFEQNVSFIYRRWAKTFSGNCCFKCTTKTFLEYELCTLFGTWWGIVGTILGPGILVRNLDRYITSWWHFRSFMRSHKG